jgi:GH35 family endo-1,4-beta-xylanase
MTAIPTVNRGANVADTEEYKKALDPYADGLPEEVSAMWNARMKTFMDLFVKHSDVITRVTAWGVHDGDSWKNDWPVEGRTDYPLLFDRNHQMKPFLKEY